MHPLTFPINHRTYNKYFYGSQHVDFNGKNMIKLSRIKAVNMDDINCMSLIHQANTLTALITNSP